MGDVVLFAVSIAAVWFACWFASVYPDAQEELNKLAKED